MQEITIGSASNICEEIAMVVGTNFNKASHLFFILKYVYEYALWKDCFSCVSLNQQFPLNDLLLHKTLFYKKNHISEKIIIKVSYFSFKVCLPSLGENNNNMHSDQWKQ